MAEQNPTNEQRLASDLQTANDIIEEMGNTIALLTKEKAFANSRVKTLTNICNRLEKEKVEWKKEKAEFLLKEKLKKEPIPEPMPMPAEDITE